MSEMNCLDNRYLGGGEMKMVLYICNPSHTPKGNSSLIMRRKKKTPVRVRESATATRNLRGQHDSWPCESPAWEPEIIKRLLAKSEEV